MKGRNEMTLNELLKKQGLTDEQIEEINAGMKENKIFTASEENLDVRYGKLKTDHDALTAKDAESQKLIAELQKATKGQEAIQGKIAEYETTIQKQNEELIKTRTESALKIGLLASGAKASDIDYLIYKISHDSDWTPELDDNGGIKGLDDKVKGMKTQFPSQFESSKQKKIEEKKLEKTDDKDDIKVTKEEFNKMGYKSRVALRESDPDLYDELTK